MSAKKKRSTPNPAGTPTLFSFFSPATRGTKYERLGSSSRENNNAGGSAKENVKDPPMISPINLKIQQADCHDASDVTSSIITNHQQLPPKDTAYSSSALPLPSPRPCSSSALPSPRPSAKRLSRRIVDDDDDDDDDDVPFDKLKRRRGSSSLSGCIPNSSPSTAGAGTNSLGELAFSNPGAGDVNAITTPNRVGQRSISTMLDSNGLLPEWQTNPKDRHRRTSDHPDYDPTTIFVPPAALAKMTPAQQQYWDVKKDHFDMVLFFKVGKFYELFDADAFIGQQHLNLLMMKGDRPHTGFPERSFSKYAERLVHSGFKVARVEQVERPNELKERNSTTGSKSKVVNRELCSILTKGTLTDGALIGNAKSVFLLAVAESAGGAEYGICFCDTSTARFHIGQFMDDPQRTRFRTLLACVAPAEIVFPASGLQPITLSILQKDLAATVLRNPLSHPWDYQNTMEGLPKYFGDDIPPIFSEHEALGVVAFGSIVMYLQRCLLDQELVKIGTFDRYNPNDSDTNTFMALDGQTISNLEIVQNSEGALQGSLLEYIDHCVTPFGHRRLHEWIIRPLVRPKDIHDRLDAVDDLIRSSETRERIRRNLKTLPDLGRLLSRIHAYACGRDSKAVMYENVSHARLNMFLDVLDGFRQATTWLQALAANEFTSALLLRLTTVGEAFPDLSPILDYFDSAFDAKAARRDGIIIPAAGVAPEYDMAQAGINAAEAKLENQLALERRALKDSDVKYVHKNNERYQLEVREATVNRMGNCLDRYDKISQRKGFVRFYTAEIRSHLDQLERANEKRSDALSSSMRLIFAEFSKHHSSWSSAVSSLADLDCLISLALTSEGTDGGTMARPEFVERSQSSPFLDIRSARHPSVSAGGSSSSSFIPNDTMIATEQNPASFLLVTGPNMGGKSTLLRQTCLCVVLAQLGCHVPAESCRLTPVDRIFTRVGACDRILTGQSTFFVELEETSTILRHATEHSLVILDELGRGTSTFDGTAIAYAVAHFLSHQIRCRTLFATHYHVLSDEFKDDPNVASYHMASQADPTTQTLIFLYKFIPGICPASFGANIAKMAGLPQEIIGQAESVTRQFEECVRVSHRDRLRQCLARRDPLALRALCHEFAAYMTII